MKIRWGLIGVGDIANKRVASAIVDDPNSELVAVCRRSERELHAFADQFGVPGRFARANDLIASGDVDAVYIATPVDCHGPQTIAAARAGKHVLVEKPMALDPAECQQMIVACDRAGVRLGVAYYRRFYPVVLRCRDLIAEGRLGRVLSIGCVTGNPNRFPADDWRVVLAGGGGGPLMDIGSHRLDVFLQLMGETGSNETGSNETRSNETGSNEIESVKASVIASDDFEAEQAATVIVSFDGGVHGILHCYFGVDAAPDRLEIIGTDGRITVEDLNRGDIELFTKAGSTRQSCPPADNFHGPLVADFSLAILENRPPMITGEIGKQTSDLIARAYRDAGRR